MNIYVKKSKYKGVIKEHLWVNFSYEGERHRKPLKLENTPKNMKLAETKILPTLQYKLMSGEFFKNNNVPTVDEYITTSFELRKGNRCDSTIYGYERSYEKYIKPVFGKKVLDKITAKDVTIWQNNLQEKNRLSKATIVKIRGIIHSMFEDAIEEDILQNNPVKKVKSLNETVNPVVKRITLKPFKQEEIKKILDTSYGQERNLLATFFFTGLRAGELIGLKWEYVDLENKTISVNEQVVNGVHKEILKTNRSKRIIPIIDVLIPFLEEQYKLTSSQNSYVFLTQKTNKHYHSAGKLREQIWVPILKKAGVSYRNLHQTRGTFISTLISNGEDINYVSKIAGHENVKITLEKYSEYIPRVNKEFGNCFITSVS